MVRQSDDAYDRLKADVVLGKLAPGSEHTEVGLAESYGMGRAAIRVALIRLGEIGLVEAVPRRGFVIAPVTASSIRDLFETRLIVEPRAAFLATRHIDVSALRKADSPVPRKASPDQRLAFLAANHAFHMTVAHATGNARLAHIIESLLDEMRRLINLGLFGPPDGSGDDAAGQAVQQDQHAQLIEAFQSRDAARAERVAREHIESSYAMARERIFDRSLSIAL